MNTLSLLATLTALLLLPPPARAFDSRTWLTADGQLVEATFVRSVGDLIEVRSKDGRPARFTRAALSMGDLDYLQANAPQERKPAVGARAAAAKIPNPARTAKVDRKQFKLAGEMKVTARSYKVYETPHFKILHLPPAEPDDLAELAERLWLDAAFFYGGFMEKWHGRKMAIIMVNDDETFKEAMLWNSADGAGANLDRAGPEGSGGTLQIPAAQAEAAGIFGNLRILRGCAAPQAGKKPQPLKGVWRPCNVHMLALDLFLIQTGLRGTFNAGGGFYYPDGNFAITAGTAFHKEVIFTGRSETRIVAVRGTGRDVVATGGFADGKPWAAELKTMLKRKGGEGGEWNPSLIESMRTGQDDARTKEIVFAWSFARFLQSTPERLMAFSHLCRKADGANQVPDLDELARIYGFTSGPEMEKAWVAWMESGDFR